MSQHNATNTFWKTENINFRTEYRKTNSNIRVSTNINKANTEKLGTNITQCKQQINQAL